MANVSAERIQLILNSALSRMNSQHDWLAKIIVLLKTGSDKSKQQNQAKNSQNNTRHYLI